MTGRDRLVVIGLVVLALLGAGWLLLVSPERKQAATLEGQVTSARQQLQSAEAQATSARSAQARYLEAYKSIVSLGKAVPPQQEVPSLIYELDQASNQRNIDFNSITTGGGAGTGGGAAAAAATASLTPTVFTQMPFTFIFKGTFFGLARLLSQIDGFAQASQAPGSAGSTATAADITGVQVSGRLLTIQSVDLLVEAQHSKLGAHEASSAPKTSELTATITATAYVLPASQGLTAGATATGPAGSGVASTSAGAGASGSPTTPAVIQVAP